MTPEELRAAQLEKRRQALEDFWKDLKKPVSPACETCGQAKLGPTPAPQKVNK